MSAGLPLAGDSTNGLCGQAHAEDREQVRERHVEGFGETPDVDQRGIALAAFDTSDIGPVQSGPVRQFLLRELQVVAEFAHPSAKCHPEVVHGQDRGQNAGRVPQTMSIICAGGFMSLSSATENVRGCGLEGGVA